MRTKAFLSIAPVLLLLGCTTAPDTDAPALGTVPTGPAALQHLGPPDLSGAWNWSNVEILRMPPFVAGLVGISPEGPNTHARCESTGTLTLTQVGSSFSGTATRTSNTCQTTGGQAFQQPGTLFQIANGRINGRNVAFSVNSPTVAPCPHQTVVSVESGIGVELSGTGHCFLPGHPQSESVLPFDPPPGGTSTATSWRAVRP